MKAVRKTNLAVVEFPKASVPPPKTNRGRYDPRNDIKYMEFLGSVRDYVNKAASLHSPSLTHKTIAEDIGRSPQTVTNFCEGKTIAPQFPTVVGILGAVDAHLEIRDELPLSRRNKSRRA